MVANHQFTIPRIKVCGLTRIEDALLAMSLGADALGCVHFEGSPRHASVEQVAAIVTRARQELEQVTLVGVLVDPTPEGAMEFARATGVTGIQIAGSAEAETWRDFPLPILRTLPVTALAIDQARPWKDIACAFVLDHASGPGGTGKQVDPEMARFLTRDFPCLLAGGLHGGNVAELVAAVRPIGVDASSRLESSPGKKDPTQLDHYIREAKLALASTSSTTS